MAGSFALGYLRSFIIARADESSHCARSRSQGEGTGRRNEFESASWGEGKEAAGEEKSILRGCLATALRFHCQWLFWFWFGKLCLFCRALVVILSFNQLGIKSQLLAVKFSESIPKPKENHRGV